MTRRITLLLLSVALAGAAWAKPGDDEEAYTRLARLSYIEGNVSYQHATDVDWAAASINLPLEPGDRIYTSTDGRAEIEFDDGSVCRLAKNTDVEILSLRDDLIQIRILVGLSSLIVSSSTDFEINTPVAAFNVLQKGSYRFQVEENGDTEAIVRKGKLEAANNDFSRRIQSGERIRIFPGNPVNPEVARYGRRDDWDEWNDRRTADLKAYGGRKYLPDTVYVGVADLHRNGRWVEIEYYGPAWVPFSVGLYWSPYSVGRWCYRPLFGWTWVSYEPWGWLPYHYGRWYRSPIYGWCWLPGPAFSFNFWSPGLVAFYSGPGWISWCPLGPGDYYDVRHYHFNRGIYGHQLSQLARLHTRERGHLFNRDAPHAFKTVSLDRFRNGSFRGQDRDSDYTRVDQPWKRGELVRDTLNIPPTVTSYRADPDRQAARPQGIRILPAVIRSNPAYNTRARDHYAPITNPRIPSLPPRAERDQVDGREATPSAAGTRQAGRWLDTPRRERAHSEFTPPDNGRDAPDLQNPGANRNEEQSGRRMTTPRVFRSTGSGGENADEGEKLNRGTRLTEDGPGIRQSAPREKSGAPAPEPRQTARPAAEPKFNEENLRQGKPAEPRPRATGSPRSETSAITVAPRADGVRAYYYRGTTTLPESDSGIRSYSSRAHSPAVQSREDYREASGTERPAPSFNDTGVRSFANRSITSRAYSPPSHSQSQGAGPAYDSRGGVRLLPAPSAGRSSGNSSSFSGGISGGSFSRPDSGPSRAQDRGSSGGGRGRR